MVNIFALFKIFLNTFTKISKIYYPQYHLFIHNQTSTTIWCADFEIRNVRH